MDSLHIVYNPLPATAPEGELSALAAVYRLILDRHTKKEAAPKAAPKTPEGDLMRSAPTQVYTSDDVLPALRELLGRYPATMYSAPEKLAGLLHVLCYLPGRPGVYEVQAALKALELDDGIAA